jgi:hypothetical protein
VKDYAVRLQRGKKEYKNNLTFGKITKGVNKVKDYFLTPH